jgi:hypothetical protein
VRNRGTQHFTFDEAFIFLRLLGSVSDDDRREEATIIGPPSRTVGVSLPSGGQKRKNIQGFFGLCQDGGPPSPPSQETRERNYSSDITGVFRKTGSFFSCNKTLSPDHVYKVPMAPHSTPAGFKGLVVDCITFPFSGNSSAPHSPPCMTNSHGWQWSAELPRVHGSLHELRSGF